MATLTALVPGTTSKTADQARLLVRGMDPLVLPWWPEELENSGWAPDYAETPRPARAMVLTRSSDPLAQLRIPFTLSADRIEVSIWPWLQAVEQLAAAKPLCQLMLGQHNRGRWRVVDAGAVERAWAANGQPSIADVTLQLRRASDAVIPIGPVKPKGRS